MPRQRITRSWWSVCQYRNAVQSGRSPTDGRAEAGCRSGEASGLNNEWERRRWRQWQRHRCEKAEGIVEVSRLLSGLDEQYRRLDWRPTTSTTRNRWRSTQVRPSPIKIWKRECLLASAPGGTIHTWPFRSAQETKGGTRIAEDHATQLRTSQHQRPRGLGC